jgi:Flp pilus assembly pilin Flp
VEYALLVALIALIAIGGITLLGQNTDATLTEIANEVGG